MKKHAQHNPAQKEEMKNDHTKSGHGSSPSEDHNLPDAEQAEMNPEAKLEVELSESRDKYLRLYSDFENYKKRVTRDRIEWTKMAGADILLCCHLYRSTI